MKPHSAPKVDPLAALEHHACAIEYSTLMSQYAQEQCARLGIPPQQVAAAQGRGRMQARSRLAKQIERIKAKRQDSTRKR